ncbi:hypothetical protein ACFW04_000433 [Cataglyphis niger]
MSTGKRLAKRSIIGTRVCAPGEDGKYYSGAIYAVKTPQTASAESPPPGQSVTPKTLYSVRFDAVPGGCPPSPSTEYSDRDLIGPGFGSVTSARLVPGQKVYLTYNGREIHAEVTEHRQHLDEVDVVIAPNGQENRNTAAAFRGWGWGEEGGIGYRRRTCHNAIGVFLASDGSLSLSFSLGHRLASCQTARLRARYRPFREMIALHNGAIRSSDNIEWRYHKIRA